MARIIKFIKAYKDPGRFLVLSLLVFVTLFHAILLFPELAESSPDLNDNVFHYSLCVSMNGEIETGGAPLDHWVPYWCAGYPIFHYYQHFPHLMVVSAYQLLLKKVSMFFIYHLFIYLLLVLYPLIVYYSLRKMRLDSLPAAGAAVFSLAMSNINGYGLEIGSFTWRGQGLYAQLWATFLLPLALSSIYTTMNENKHYFRSVIFLFCLTLSQIQFGLMAILTSFLFLPCLKTASQTGSIRDLMDLDWGEIFKKFKRLTVILVFFSVAVAYLIVPMQMDSQYYTNGNYISPETTNSFGARYIITQFINGKLLDHGRWPIATALVIVGLLFSLGVRSPGNLWVAAGFIFWFLLYFGRPTWGLILDIIPFSSTLQLLRLISMVHFFSAILAGIGLMALYEKIKLKANWIAAFCLIILLLYPVFRERFLFLQLNNDWLRSNKISYQKEKQDLGSMLDAIKKAPPGRVYPGSRTNWGGNFKIGQTAVMYFLSEKEIPDIGFTPFSWALPADFSLNFTEWNPSHYDLFNVKYVLAEKGINFSSFIEEIKRYGRFRLYSVKTTGYFDLVESPIALYGDKDSIWNIMLLWMRSSLISKKQYISIFFDRDHHTGYQDYLTLKDRWSFWRSGKLKRSGDARNLFSMDDPLRTSQYPEATPGAVISEIAGKDRFSCKVKADKDCFLLFKMTYHPGWHAYIDGKEKDKVMLSPGMIGVKLNKGEHSVKFIYSAQKWKMPLFYIGMFSLLALFGWERKRKK